MKRQKLILAVFLLLITIGGISFFLKQSQEVKAMMEAYRGVCGDGRLV